MRRDPFNTGSREGVYVYAADAMAADEVIKSPWGQLTHATDNAARGTTVQKNGPRKPESEESVGLEDVQES